MIEFENVDKYYGAFHALKDISISVREGERMVICGPSGSGKSTLIRCINGLEFHNSGTLTVDGIEVHAHSKKMPILRQQVGMVFQQFNHRRTHAVELGHEGLSGAARQHSVCLVRQSLAHAHALRAVGAGAVQADSGGTLLHVCAACCQGREWVTRCRPRVLRTCDRMLGRWGCVKRVGTRWRIASLAGWRCLPSQNTFAK